MQVSQQDDWIEERCLGTGAFGTVTLWKHKFNHEYLAIKKCRLDLSPANRQRWHQEVEILKKLDHTNIVKAKDVPAILDVSGGEIPLLAMEYCEGGDLRRILNTPENIRGLKESTVIKVTADVAHAIEFLHSKRIIHRDLKPENIVIQHTDGKDIYKLIDLGYAKQLDQYSIATTFVGTLRYLAPELLAGNGSYTKTVDYWSLGTVLFECITGIRPFPDLSPVNWHREIGQKSPRHIHAFYNASDEMTFSEVFPELNTLSRCFQEKYVNLLRLLLLWDPVKRGGQVHEDGSRLCYKLLNQILDSKVVHIFCAFTSTLLAFEVTETDKREDINARIYEETGIALDDQVIVSPAGQEIGADSPMLEYIHKNNGTPSTLYLFSKSNIPASPRPLFTLPSTLQSVVTESKTLLPYLEQKRIHAEALSFCYKQMKNYKYLIQAHVILLKYTLKLHSRLSQLRANLTSDCIRLEERIAFCRESLHTDIKHFSEVAVELHANDTILRSWREGERNWIHFDKSGVMEVEKLAISAQTQVLELQKIPFNQSQPVSNPMEEIYNSAVIVYDDFKRANLTSYDQKMADCSKIAEVVLKCLTKREKLNKEMLTHLRRILQCATELQNVVPKVIEKTRQIAHNKDHILQIQKQRQEDVWCLISDKQDSVDSGISYPTLDLTLSSYKMDSSELTKQSLQNIERLSEVVQSVKVEYDNVTPQNLDWTFLEEDTEEDDSKLLDSFSLKDHI